MSPNLKMASVEQLELSNFIKTVHENLRGDAKTLGANEAWLKHSKDEATLQRYAEAMRTLATKYWESHSASDPKAVSRIRWVHKVCCDYFDGNGLIKHREREKEIACKADFELSDVFTSVTKPYRLLDVGSCYNPFGAFNEFRTTAIDIAPATANVTKCDFLNVPVTRSSSETEKLFSLPENYYHVIVFSLVLEYLPSAEQRLLFCKKAYKLLKTEGLLFIITPDSKHVGANFKIMKTWKFLLAEMGFSRIQYEKMPHIHCMAFRKSVDCRITQRWAELHRDHNYYGAFVIPQDFNASVVHKIEEPQLVQNNYENNGELLSELPYFSNDDIL